MTTQHHSLHSALKEFFDPLRTNDSRADFYAVYRRESGGFDQDYARKYDEDLNTSLIFVSPLFFPAVLSANLGACRPVFSLQSLQLLSQLSNQNQNRIQPRRPRFTCRSSSTPRITRSSPT